jgi:molybdopterin-containing oxidoreductase family iron-sulfur binding subunit
MKIKRRRFLQISAISTVGAMFGCSSDVDKVFYPFVKAPDDAVAGRSLHYASTCRECPAGCGILVKTREGRAVKIEGNPLHPVNRGKLCMRGQAALQGVYHPDRLRKPLLKKNGALREIGLDEALAVLRNRTATAAHRGGNRVRMLTGLPGEGFQRLMEAAADKWNSGPPVIFEHLACGSLKAACNILFGRPFLPAYAIQKADFLLSFGADFLETWLSPVSHAGRFKEMHAMSAGKKGLFYDVSPHQTLTAANADRWFCCRPGSGHLVALWLIRGLMEDGREIPAGMVPWLEPLVAGHTRKTIVLRTGLDVAELDALLSTLRASEHPLVLGAGAAAGEEGVPVDLGALLLNLISAPSLPLMNFDEGHRLVEAAGRGDVIAFFDELTSGPAEVLILHGVNPVYSLPTVASVRESLSDDGPFVVSLTGILDDTARHADLVIPICHPLESWDEFASDRGTVSLLQPAMASPNGVLQAGDVILRTAFGNDTTGKDYKSFMVEHLRRRGLVQSEGGWIRAVRRGGFFPSGKGAVGHPDSVPTLQTGAGRGVAAAYESREDPPRTGRDAESLRFLAAPSIRYFDGRSAYAPWLSEVPDPLTCVAWQTPALVHPDTLQGLGISHEDVIRLETEWGAAEAIAYETEGVHPRAVVLPMGQGHSGGGRYADGKGQNPLALLPPTGPGAGGAPVTVRKVNRAGVLANTDGSRIQHGRKIALSVSLNDLAVFEKHHGESHGEGLGMNDFPLTLPLPGGYDPDRDIYPPHDHEGYRWAMTVDLDRCIGCGACAVACYAENNVGVVGEKQIIEGREMAWLRVERYHDMGDPIRITFLPMMCQHCDNAPCESVCPVYAPHHSKEGLNNQVYNRCIGTRFCSQNCPYKVRRFNWFDGEWPASLNRQLNPDVTVRAKGVMEKCSFCVQRIKEAHGRAKYENRNIRDGEVIPACVQTCPTGALVFGNLMDLESRVRRLAEDPRAYQVMGYLNTKPAVIYLKKVLHDGTAKKLKTISRRDAEAQRTANE